MTKRSPMEETPPRRRRPESPRSAPLPLVPILIGVVITGFAIGAGISLLTQRSSNTNNSTTVVLASQAPVKPARSPRPATPEPTPEPTATAKPHRSPAPLASARIVHATAEPTALPLSTPMRATLPPVPHATLLARVNATPAPRITAMVVTAAPTRLPVAMVPRPIASPPRPALTARPVAPVTAPPEVSDDADSSFARLSAGVVRGYLSALVRGDDASAQALLAARPNSRAGTLSEKAFTDSSMRITSLDAHGTDDGATVNVDVATSKGNYFVRFSLRRNNNGAAVIVDHDFIKP